MTRQITFVPSRFLSKRACRCHSPIDVRPRSDGHEITARGDIDTVTHQVAVTLLDHIAEMDTDKSSSRPDRATSTFYVLERRHTPCQHWPAHSYCNIEGGRSCKLLRES